MRGSFQSSNDRHVALHLKLTKIKFNFLAGKGVDAFLTLRPPGNRGLAWFISFFALANLEYSTLISQGNVDTTNIQKG